MEVLDKWEIQYESEKNPDQWEDAGILMHFL